MALFLENIYISFLQEGGVLYTVLLLGISLLYYLASNLKVKWKILSPGTIFSSIFIIITSVLFSSYISNFASYNQIYGSIGTLIIILLWIYFNSIILLTGFEINVSIFASKKYRSLNSDL